MSPALCLRSNRKFARSQSNASASPIANVRTMSEAQSLASIHGVVRAARAARVPRAILDKLTPARENARRAASRDVCEKGAEVTRQRASFEAFQSGRAQWTRNEGAARLTLRGSEDAARSIKF